MEPHLVNESRATTRISEFEPSSLEWPQDWKTKHHSIGLQPIPLGKKQWKTWGSDAKKHGYLEELKKSNKPLEVSLTKGSKETEERISGLKEKVGKNK